MLTPSQVIAIADAAHSTFKMILGEPMSPNRGSRLLMLSAAMNNKTVFDVHGGWMCQKFDDDWDYGPVKDIVLKRHPWLRDLSELDDSVVRKNLLFLNTVNVLIPSMAEIAASKSDPVAAQWVAVKDHWDEFFTVKISGRSASRNTQM